MISDYRVVGSVARLTIFYWLVFTIISLAKSPMEFMEALSHWFNQTKYTLLLVALCSALAVASVLLKIYLNKKKILSNLRPDERLGIHCTKGPVPAKDFLYIDPNAPMKPLHGELLKKWIETQNKIAQESGKESVYVNLLEAVWRIYSQYEHFPASHRIGGHGDRRLYLHCHDVAEHCLRLAQSGWVYEGIFVKKRGRKPIKIHSPNSDNSVLNPNDPLIPIIGLAHDIGKLLCYEVDKQGSIIKNLEGNSTTQDDDSTGVMHDYLGPRILAQLPEFWALNARDRNAITLAMAFYHHPSAIPLKSNDMLLDERAAILMSLLIQADREVSASESGVDFNDEVDEDYSEEIYSAFANIISTFGRINGVGTPAIDRKNMIGMKYANCIVIRERPLRLLLLQQLNLTEEGGDKRYDFTLQLLSILKERGLLYTQHENTDFSDYLPMYRVALYHHIKKKHMTTFSPALVIKVPDASMPEFESLGFLELHNSIPVFESVMTTHLKKVKNPELLEQLNKQAFGDEAAQLARLEVEPNSEEMPEEIEIKDEPEEEKVSLVETLSDESAAKEQPEPEAESTQTVKKEEKGAQTSSKPKNEVEKMEALIEQIEGLESNVRDIRPKEERQTSREVTAAIAMFGLGKPEGEIISNAKPNKKRNKRRRQDFDPVPELYEAEKLQDFKELEKKSVPKAPKETAEEKKHREEVALKLKLFHLDKE